MYIYIYIAFPAALLAFTPEGPPPTGQLTNVLFLHAT